MIPRPAWAYYDAPAPEGAVPPGPEVVNANTDLVLSLFEGRPVWFRGQPYVIPPIPFRDGVKLDRFRKEWDAAVAREDAEAVLALYPVGVKMLGRLILPLHPIRRWFRWALKNPFRDASNGEFNDLVLFCLVCRMTSTIQGSAPEGPLRRAQSLTKQTYLRSSPKASRAG